MKAPAITCLIAFGTIMTVPCLQASMEGSKHDFRSRLPESDTPGSSREICVFCHTPVGGDAESNAPLWNRLTQERSYRRFASFGASNLEQDSAFLGTVSLPCLSCHDGTQAVDSGFLDTQTRGAEADLNALNMAVPIGPSWATPMAGYLADHPTQVSYAGGACAGLEGDCDPAKIVRGSGFRTVQFDVINSAKSWWLDTTEGAPGIRDRSDIILYPRNQGGTVGPSVECGSCHDPHDGRRRPVSFLRLPAGESALCLTCHIK